MFCVKCGKKIAEDQVFCPECLAVMERYPVKPGTTVHLPNRPESSSAKKVVSRKKEVTPERIIIRQRRWIRALSGLLVLCMLLLGGAVYMLNRAMTEEPTDETIGQNYGTIDHKDTTP